MHITQRGNNRITTFADVADFAQYRLFLHHARELEDCAIHAYALMTNHVHLLVTSPQRTGASRMMQSLGRLYVRYFNGRHHRTGTLWEGRFKSALVDSSTYFLKCSRYIDLNPVLAGLVDSAEAYPWSSFACLGLQRSDPLITLHPEYVSLGHNAAQRSLAYRTFCGVTGADTSRAAIRRATRGGAALGDDAFYAGMRVALRRDVTRHARRASALSDGTERPAAT